MKKQNLPNRSFLNYFAMQTIFVMFLFVSNIFPQVVIEERVEINPDMQKVEADFMLLNNSSLVMLKTGLLKVNYSFIKHYNVELPDYSLLKVKFLKNNVMISDSVKPRFQNYNWWTNYMYNHCSQQYEWREGYNYAPGPYVELGSVVEGDTVQFTYYSDNVETQQPIEYDIYSATQNGTSWNVKLGNYNNCLLDFDNLLQVYLYIYDEEETIYADIDPGVLYPGDTAQVVIKRRLPGGILEDYPPEQTFEVGMLEGCILGNILVGDSLDTYFYDVTQPIKFIADTTGDSSGVVLLSVGLVDTSSLSKIRRLANLRSEYCFYGDPLTDYVTAMVEVKEPELIIIEPTTTTVDTFITAEPSMPELILKAKLEGYTGGEYTFEWKYVLSWTSTSDDPDRTIQRTFEGSEPGILSGITSWEIDWDDAIIGGDNDTLFVSVYTVPRVYKDTLINPYRILGTNPTRQEIREGLTTHEQIVVYLESSPKWHHFNNNGFPIWGNPHGYGLMQLDPATDEQIWNWRANREEGKNRLAIKRSLAEGYPSRVRNGTAWRDDPVGDWYPIKYLNAIDFTTDEQIWKEAHHRYVGGAYWRWKPVNPKDKNSSGEWISSPRGRHSRGEEAWEIYEGIQIGIYPPGWDN